jgi:hypothetical protein
MSESASTGSKKLLEADNIQNQSPMYSKMLLCQSLTKHTKQWRAGKLDFLPKIPIQEKIPIILAQILSQTPLSQEDQGSWANGAHESRHTLC